MDAWKKARRTPGSGKIRKKPRISKVLRNCDRVFADYLSVRAFERPTPSRPQTLPCHPEATCSSKKAASRCRRPPTRGRPTMTTTIDRAEINRRNAPTSTGPRTTARQVAIPVQRRQARLPRPAADPPRRGPRGLPGPPRRLDRQVPARRRRRALPGRARRPRLLAARPRRPRRGRPTRRRGRRGGRPAGREGRQAGGRAVPRPRPHDRHAPRPRPGRRRRGTPPLLALRPEPSRPPLPPGRRAWRPPPIGCSWLRDQWADAGEDPRRRAHLAADRPAAGDPAAGQAAAGLRRRSSRCCRSTWPATRWTRRARTSSPSR